MLSELVAYLGTAAPVATRALVALVIARPEIGAAALFGVGALHFFARACFWYARHRDARRAGRAAQVDAAARWVLAELASHETRWRSVSGNAQPLPPSELRARVPHSVLADRSLWKLVANRVRCDEHVLVAPKGSYTSSDGGASVEEGWLFVQSPLSPVLSPVAVLSPRANKSPLRCSPLVRP